MMVIAREFIVEVEEIAGAERADGLSERISMLLPMQAWSHRSNGLKQQDIRAECHKAVISDRQNCALQSLSLHQLNMQHQQLINTSEACILAVEALDNIVIDLLHSSPLETSPGFLDWVADEATPLVQLSVVNALRVPRFVDSLRLGPPKIGITHWVRYWLGPLIALKFVGMPIQPGRASAHTHVHLLPASAIAIARK